MARSSTNSADYPTMSDSGVEDDLLSSVGGDLRSLSDFDEHPPKPQPPLPLVSPHLRQFLRAMRAPKMAKNADGAYDTVVDGATEGAGGGGSPEQPDLEFDWWEGQCSFLGGGLEEGDVLSWHLDTMEKVQVLERQVTVLAENQSHGDDRFTRVKEDNAALQARLIMLEEQLRDAELRSEEQLSDERRRHKEILQRLEREKTLELENQAIRLQSLEKEVRFAEAEASRTQQLLAATTSERTSLDSKLIQLQVALEEARQESSRACEMEELSRQELEQQRHVQAQALAELSSQLEKTERDASERLKSESDESELMRLKQADLEEELKQLRQQNKELVENNEELQAQLLSNGLQEGRQLLESGPKSLAVELDDMSGEQATNEDSSEKLRKSLNEQQECNRQLRTYIDGILLSIVENYPQLLEVKQQQQQPQPPKLS